MMLKLFLRGTDKIFEHVILAMLYTFRNPFLWVVDAKELASLPSLTSRII